MAPTLATVLWSSPSSLAIRRLPVVGVSFSSSTTPRSHGFPELAEIPEQADQAKKYKSADLFRSIMQGNSGLGIGRNVLFHPSAASIAAVTIHRTPGS